MGLYYSEFFSSTRKAGHHLRRRRRHHCSRRGTRHLRAAEAKKGMLLRGDPDAINNNFFIVARHWTFEALVGAAGPVTVTVDT